MNKFFYIYLLSILFFYTNSHAAKQLAQIQNKTNLTAYAALQSIKDPINNLNFQKIEPQETVSIGYEVDGQPKRLAFALGFKPTSQEDFTTYTVGPKSSAKGIFLILAPIPDNIKTIPLIKSEPYENGILGDGYVLYPIPRIYKPTNITALHIRQEQKAEIMTPPSDVPPVPVQKEEISSDEQEEKSAEERIAQLQKILDEMKSLQPSDKEAWDSMTKDELAQEYYRLNTELEDAEYLENELAQDARIKQLFIDISYIRSLLDR